MSLETILFVISFEPIQWDREEQMSLTLWLLSTDTREIKELTVLTDSFNTNSIKESYINISNKVYSGKFSYNHSKVEMIFNK